MGVFPLTGKVVRSNDDTAVREHMLFCDTKITTNDFSIIAYSQNNFKSEIQESILIKQLSPPLNKNITSVPLDLSN